MNRSQARDEIYAVLKAAWDTTGVTLLYSDVEGDIDSTQQPNKTEPQPFARATLSHNDRSQVALGNANGQIRYEAQGVLVVQIFTPLGEGLSNADSYAILIEDAFDGARTPGGARFKNVTSREIGSDGPWFQTNVTVEFYYDEVK